MTEYPKAYLYKRIVQAKLFIDANFDGPIDLGQISSESHFSKFHFIRLFKQAYGKTPGQYLTSVRVSKAADLLKLGLPVSSVCYAVGFESTASFSHLFRKQVRLSPSAFQKQQLNRISELNERPLHFIPSCFAASRGWL